MKKDILFIIPSLSAGGGEKSLINLLEQIDYKRYNVDLFALNKEGLFLDFVPSEVNVIENSIDLEIFKLPLHKSIIKFLSKGKLQLTIDRIMFFIKNKKKISISKREQYAWKYIRGAIGSLDKNYDVAIGYLEKTSNYICVDCVQANKKIGWIHTDYNKLEADKAFDDRYLSKLDYIVTVSEECGEVLKKEFNNIEKRVKVIKNIVSPSTIRKMSLENIDITKNDNEKILVSVGRLSHEKGFDIAVKACKILKDNGMKIKWILVGEGIERSLLEKLINENQLKDEFLLIGASSNPYKYLSKADIYVQPSRFEGKSIAMDEAKILNKPIVATNFSTVKDQITDKVDGIITEMNSKDLASGIEKLIKDNELYFSIIKNLNKMSFGTESEIYKLYTLID
ncbi:glycosyltransferase [uncultured Clostridium sp.]|uniref:glycosyltransferase n=1 Tax=uncultured Clostridium sp. TaxID=59620 RepID=UPI0025E69D4B|nr:glycosyltransferase [uncultured Clostridium sp.]MDU4323844.1 glycosyltransferase [Clostridium celatum]